MTQPIALLTNDDGIHSPFLHALVKSFKEQFRVIVVAPTKEQSWVSRSVSRHTSVCAKPIPDMDCEAWAIEGTPTDCVNIALTYLLPEKPSVVASGINIGYNLGLPMVMSSGTVGGAIEGALWKIPSAAFSLAIEDEKINGLRDTPPKCDPSIEESLNAAAAHAAQFCQKIASEKLHQTAIHNINFPTQTKSSTPTRKTSLAQFPIGALFATEDSQTFQFEYPGSHRVRGEKGTDVECIREGEISHTVLDFSKI